MENELQLIRINTNYIHNDEQLKNDMYKVKTVMRSIKKTTLSLRMNVLNLLLDTNEDVNFKSTLPVFLIITFFRILFRGIPSAG